jgi:cell division protein ZapA
MASSKETLTVKIFDAPYALEPAAGTDSPDVEKLAKYVDTRMHDISERIASVSSTKIAVLTALEIAQELFELQNTLEKEADTTNKRIAKLIKSIEKTT